MFEFVQVFWKFFKKNLFQLFHFLRFYSEEFILSLGLLSLTGVLIQTGSRGVLLRFGKIQKLLDPGFHLLIPFVHKVKKVHMRDRTLDLYSQRVTTADGVVYEVDANLVFRIEDPIKAAVNIDHIRSGCETVLALRVQELFKKKTWEEIQQGRGLNEELQALVQVKLQDWGIVALRADFTSLSPSLRSLPLTQFHLRVEKRKNLLRFFQASPLPTSLSLTLLAPEHLPQSHSHHCYHEIQYQRLQERRYQRHKARKDSTDWGLFL